MKKLLIAAALIAAPAASWAATTVDFNIVAIAWGDLAYSPGHTQYNWGASTPATVAGVTFAGMSGIDNGPFGFPSSESQKAFLQSYAGETDGSITLTGLGLHYGSYSVSFDSAARPIGGVGFTISQGDVVLATYLPGDGSSLVNSTFTFLSTGTGALTFAAINSNGVDSATAIDNITVTAVPEPATWGLLLAGFVMTGFAVRRRRVSIVAA